ncbi:hypothetical protein FRB99_005469 [Tulasnella sp. 403]|nr:hypothetical protein FRB99_005469 [Tulasnella sp. 403]
MSAFKTFLILLPFLSTPVFAWGPDGHAAVADIASEFLLPETQTIVKNLIETEVRYMGLAMGAVASWADDHRATKQGQYSGKLHYIDAKDNPPQECGIVMERDCPDGCVITAIANYTTRLTDPTVGPFENAEALKFLVHFIGDVHQPMHTEDKAKGGNGIMARWQGTKRNLHRRRPVWDSEILKTMVKDSGLGSTNAWASNVTQELRGGRLAPFVPQWISCTNPNDAINCSLEWAKESNAFACSYIFVNRIEGKELARAYYQGAKPIVEEQIARAGVRLAAWLNMIYTGKTGFEPAEAVTGAEVDVEELVDLMETDQD